MKPRHLKNQLLDKYKITTDKKSNSDNKSKKKPNDQNKSNMSNLYSNLIPFHKTPQYNEFLEWIQNWNQSQPACILFGPVSCGKTRTIQQLALQLLCHVIEIDCALIPTPKDLVSTFQESTKSRSVGIFLNHDNTNYDNAMSMVVLEHIDSIITFHDPPPSSIINLISKSRVPLIMTSQTLCIQPAAWIKVIPFQQLNNSFSILKSADWIKDSIHEIPTNQAIHSMLSFTDQDIRQTSLQYQVWGNNSNSILTRDRQIYLSIPLAVQQKEDQKEKRDFYADICDLYTLIDHNDQIFDSYIMPISEDFKSKERERLFKDYVEFANIRVRHEYYSYYDNVNLTEIVYQACVNDQQYTRHTTKVNLSNGHKIKSNEIQYVKSWNLWPYASRDLRNNNKNNEIVNQENTITENESVIRTENENQIEKAEDIKTEDIKEENIKEENMKTEDIKEENMKTEDIKEEDIKEEDIKEENIKEENIKSDEIKPETELEPKVEKTEKKPRGRPKKKTGLIQKTLL